MRYAASNDAMGIKAWRVARGAVAGAAHLGLVGCASWEVDDVVSARG